MDTADLPVLLKSWGDALCTFEEALALPETPVVRDAAIKRFEYNFELAWKTIKRFAEIEGVTCNSPRSAFKSALQLGWIADAEIWLDMLDDRNLTAHTYHEGTAAAVYGRLPGYAKVLRRLLGVLRRHGAQ